MTNERVLLPTATGKQTRAALARLLRRYPLRTFLTVTTLLAASGVALLGPLMLGQIVDRVVEGRGAGSLTTPVVVLFVVAVLEGVFVAIGFGLLTNLGETVLAD